MDTDENPPKRRRLMRPQELFYYNHELYKKGLLSTPPEIKEYVFKDGERIEFSQGDILLPYSLESDIVIRKLVAYMPSQYFKRLKYLDKCANENNYEHILRAHLKESRLKLAFKKLYNAYKIYKIRKSSEEGVDPFTLCAPEKRVHILDWRVKKEFTFDAKSLSRHIHSLLLYQEYGFPAPQYPRNPNNNIKFTYEQLISIYYQIKEHGELLWTLSTFRECNFLKSKWNLYNKATLIVRSIKETIFSLETYEGREMLLDFIVLKLEELDIQYDDDIIKMYENAINTNSEHWYISLFKQPALLYYECEHFGINKEQYINIICNRIFKKQEKFIKEMEHTI